MPLYLSGLWAPGQPFFFGEFAGRHYQGLSVADVKYSIHNAREVPWKYTNQSKIESKTQTYFH